MSFAQGISTFLSGKHFNRHAYWRKWFLTMSIFSLIHLWTIGVAPFLHSDEFLILDLGRIILHPDTDWSIAWLIDQDQPVFVWFYLGPVAQELVYQAFGQYGPRISALVGAVFAATVMVAWLLSKNTSPKAAFIWGLVFFLDPIFVQSFSLGRVDSWTIGLCISACWIVQDTKLNVTDERLALRRIMIAGALITTAFFIWPSAVFLFPLITLEFINFSREGTSGVNWRKFFLFGTSFGSGALIVGVLILIPIAPQVYMHLDNVTAGIATNTRSGPSSAKDWSVYTFSQIIELFRILKFTPVLLVIAAVAIVLKRRHGLFLAVLVALMLMVSTVVYIQRVLYLLPYLVAAGASLYQHEHRPSTDYRRIRLGVLTGCVVWCVSLSVFARTTLALDKSDERERLLVYKAAESMLGAGEYKVFMPNEFYYAARSLGWQMYKPYLAQNDPITPEILRHILLHVDYVIAEPKSGMSKDLYEVLRSAGMREGPGFQIYKTARTADNVLSSNARRLRNLYSIFRKPYGPYQVYSRGRAVSVSQKR